MKRLQTLFTVVAVIALLLMLFLSVQGKSGESCQCYFIGDCEYDARGIGYRYYWCGGSCAAYAGWQANPRCLPLQVLNASN